MKKFLLLIIALPLLAGSCQNEEKLQATEYVPLNAEIRPLIHDIGSKWVYQDRYGNKDSAIIIGIDSSIVKRQSMQGNFMDLQVVEINYSPNKTLGEKQILQSNYVFSQSQNWSPARANLMYFSKRDLKNGQAECMEGDCISLVETVDVMLINGVEYTDVSRLKTDSKEFWWDPSIGIIKFESAEESWELIRTNIKS